MTRKSKSQRLLENYHEARFAVREVTKGLFGNGPVATAKLLRGALTSLPARIERGALAVQQFVGVYPLDFDPDADEQLQHALEAISKELSGFAKVRGLHSARIMFLDDQDPQLTESEDRADVKPEPGARGALVLGLIYDGLLSDVLATLVAENPKLVALLSRCQGFPRAISDDHTCAFVAAGRLPGGYFFSDLPDVAQSEIARAAEIRKAFNDFQAAHPHGPTQRQFKAFWAGLGEQRAPISWLEQRLEDEDSWSRRALEFNRCSQEREERLILRGNPHGSTPRGVHVKHHGCLEAEFIVNPELPARFRRGVFRAAKFDALVRLSNSQKRARADRAFDGRGMAIKLLAVSGERTLPPFPQGWPKLDQSENQDFVLLSHPTFFTKDVIDFTILQAAFEAGDKQDKILRSAVYFMRRPRALATLARTVLRRIEHPLDIVYHSATPYLLGSDRAVKYSVVPVLAKGASFLRSTPDHGDPDFLRKVLQESLTPDDARIELKFMIHVLPDQQRAPVEDACADWDKLGAKTFHAATLVIKSQDFSTAELLERAERVTFNPWNGLAAHKPLGSLNRGVC